MSVSRGRTPLIVLSIALGCLPALAAADGKPGTKRGLLTEDQIIESEELGYKLQYRAYLPPGHANLKDLPAVYVTDGQWYLSRGQMVQLLDRLIRKGKIEPIVAVFIDNRDPDDLSVNRRNAQFFCNQDYADFVGTELVPVIDARYATRSSREARVILGLSFGGLNSLCFGLQAQASFQGVAMQSPALHPVPGIYDAYEENPRMPLRFFVSTGTLNDNLDARRLKKILEKKGYDFQYREVKAGHDWHNWKPLLDDVLIYFFGTEARLDRSN